MEMRIKKFNESRELNDRIKDLGYIQDLFVSLSDEFNVSIDCVYYEYNGESSGYFFAEEASVYQGYSSDGHLFGRGQFKSKSDFIMVSGEIDFPCDMELLEKSVMSISKQIKSSTSIKKFDSHCGNPNDPYKSSFSAWKSYGSYHEGSVEFYIKFFY
jgi:hypothetical protein